MSALQALGGDEGQGDLQAQGGQPAQRLQGQPVARRTQVARPQIDAVQQPPAEDSMSDVQQSALQALGGMDEEVASNVEQAQPIDEAQPVEQSQLSPNAGHVGQWKASMASGATVELTLQADGSFSWVATSSGKTSSFQGNYTVDGGSLTLVRSSDNQKLAGSLTPLGSGGMNFKLNGAKDTGLNFERS